MSRNQFPFFLFFFSFSFFSFSFFFLFSFFFFFCEYFPSVTANILYLVNRICIGIRYTVESFTGCTVGKSRVKFFPSNPLSVYYWPLPSWTVDQRTISFSYNYKTLSNATVLYYAQCLYEPSWCPLRCWGPRSKVCLLCCGEGVCCQSIFQTQFMKRHFIIRYPQHTQYRYSTQYICTQFQSLGPVIQPSAINIKAVHRPRTHSRHIPVTIHTLSLRRLMLKWI